MKVIREPTADELEEGTVLTTRSVYDWRSVGWEPQAPQPKKSLGYPLVILQQ